jgi:hypothetical protein
MNSDEEYNRRCDNGEAKCVDCDNWADQLTMDYDDDTGFHSNCENCRIDQSNKETIKEVNAKMTKSAKKVE